MSDTKLTDIWNKAFTGLGGTLKDAKKVLKKTKKPPNNLVDSASKEYYSKGIPRNPDPNLNPQRPFHEDYPKGAKTDSAGRLLETIDGDPIMPGSLLAGHRSHGGVGQGLLGKDTEHLGSQVVDSIFKVPEEEILGDFGRFNETWRESDLLSPLEMVNLLGDSQKFNHRIKQELWKRPRDPNLIKKIEDAGYDYKKFITLADNLAPEDSAKVLAHEIAHSIDFKVQNIPTKGVQKELLTVYNDLNNLDFPQGSFQPRIVEYSGKEYKYPGKTKLLPSEIKGYPKKENPFELWAEAIRAYMVDPDYIKTVAPKVAKRIRKYVNTHPELKNIIQFNAFAPVGVTGLLAEEQLSQE